MARIFPVKSNDQGCILHSLLYSVFYCFNSLTHFGELLTQQLSKTAVVFDHFVNALHIF